MKYIFLFLLSTAITGSMCAQELSVFRYEVDVIQNPDTFFITLTPEKLKKEDTLFQFAATAPGTYQTMDIGRFVSRFRALDKKGRDIAVIHSPVNQFVIAEPHRVEKITYQVAETFDTRVREYPIYLMCGSSIEDDHALINAHTVLGYFAGYQKAPIEMSVVGRDTWVTGTALEQQDGVFLAESYEHAVDSPILMGDLTYADTVIAETKIALYAYSARGKVLAKPLLLNMSDMLDAARKFLVDLPVDRYTFLYFFEPDLKGEKGAWEHSYSSEYVLDEADPTPAYLQKVTDIASHEFFHIVTPLNIHSEIIESFNFVQPTPSVHLWMYEGVTEWASDMLLYRGGVVDLNDYLNASLAHKILVNEKYFDSSWSLKKLSEESFKGGEGARQYGNIYYRGALVATLLDIKLLELSKGAYGLRELILDLVAKYGKGKPVSEATFFDDIAEMTYPEIRLFFDNYVLKADPLPYEYFGKVGLKLERNDDGTPVVRKLKELTPEQEQLFGVWSRNLER